MKARAYLCDLDGTLYQPALMKWLMAAELALFGPHQMAKLQAFRRAHEALREELRADPELHFSPSPFHEQLRRAAERHQMPEAELEAVVTRWMVQRPGKWIARFARAELIEELRQFQQGGGRLAIVSDYPAQEKLRAMGLGGLFDVVVASGEHPELRRLKPSPDGFLLAARELDVPAEDCVVLGDRPDADGEAARRAGMAFRHVQ